MKGCQASRGSVRRSERRLNGRHGRPFPPRSSSTKATAPDPRRKAGHDRLCQRHHQVQDRQPWGYESCSSPDTTTFPTGFGWVYELCSSTDTTATGLLKRVLRVLWR